VRSFSNALTREKDSLSETKVSWIKSTNNFIYKGLGKIGASRRGNTDSSNDDLYWV
jgi:hypothetical protein